VAAGLFPLWRALVGMPCSLGQGALEHHVSLVVKDFTAFLGREPDLRDGSGGRGGPFRYQAPAAQQGVDQGALAGLELADEGQAEGFLVALSDLPGPGRGGAKVQLGRLLPQWIQCAVFQQHPLDVFQKVADFAPR